MEIRKDTAADAFADLERDAIHPSDEEIAAAAEGTASEFTAAEIRAHAGWCSRCGEVAADFRQFCLPPEHPISKEDVDWSWHRLLRAIAKPATSKWTGLWIAAAAGFLICALPATLWFLRNGGVPNDIVTVQKGPQGAGPNLLAGIPSVSGNVPVLDLFPETAAQRSAQGAQAVRLPDQLPQVVTLILNNPGFRESEASARLLDAGGREVWTGKLTRQSGVFTLAIAEQTLRQRPLTVELAAPGGAAVNYRLQ